jgi:hypothetical protein
VKKLFTIYADETHYIIEYNNEFKEICDDDIMECLERAVRHARIVHKKDEQK